MPGIASHIKRFLMLYIFTLSDTLMSSVLCNDSTKMIQRQAGAVHGHSAPTWWGQTVWT